jgi:starch synthase (maltosyl-transferring)
MSRHSTPSADPRFDEHASDRGQTVEQDRDKPEDGRRRVYIQGIAPEIDAGQYPAKRILGDQLTVSVDLVADGHDVLAGQLWVRPPPGNPSAGSAPREVAYPLLASVNDRYSASCELNAIGRWHYSFEAWVDAFATWRGGLEKKLAAEQDVNVDLLVGAELLGAAAERATGQDRDALSAARAQLSDVAEPLAARAQLALRPELLALMGRHPDRAHATRHARWLPLWVDRERARFSAWYELFPRSTGEPGQHGTFRSTLARLPYVASMGFDVLYLPPVHPIGHTFRKGKNNSPNATESDVGSPWAIGSAEGGHKSVHPALGSLEDFRALAAEAGRHGLELALDIALQVTPDHPYVKEHPEWFKRRPDGSIQYAENPPKKYQDIYPFDFECDAWWSLWLELKSIFEFWVTQGVRIFRVDNPHTKSLPFWQWCIAELTRDNPDLIFLAEAFTRPKLMYLLAKLGFTQSYTYFTWRNTGRELREYLEELTTPPVREFFRPNFWPTTPDILPEHLQHAGRAAFSLRLVLAATLSSNYGVYGPAFELMDNVPRPGVEEYLDNEKYELKSWAPDRPDTLKPLIARINAIRKNNRALQHNLIAFHPTDNELLLCFSKQAPDEQNAVLVIINLDVHHAQAGWVDLDLPTESGALARPARPPELGQSGLQLHDLLSDARYSSQERRLFVRLDPQSAPAHIFLLRRRARTEHDFDYFV